MLTTRHETASLPVAALVAQADGLLGTIVTVPLDHPEFDLLNDRWMKLDSLILQTPSHSIRDQVAQLRHLLAVLLNEDVSPYAEALARKALAEMETLEN
ncbi:hypothetical protein [Acidisphaera sp. S103]|uniref:hypothetical protein n=1 Tax=Acidisphaera sp. S103 TaxID=1747223 RepID=UPI00131A6729|nr:hypothetical protein [Acidisphaera sp. S103]